jgi:hypothetical protein
MQIFQTFKYLVAITITAFAVNGCKIKNHIDTYNVNIDTLKTLPDNFYAHRRGRIYLEDTEAAHYRIWFNKDKEGNVTDIFKIEDLRKNGHDPVQVINTYAIDTSMSKNSVQKFIDLSRRYKFGHILIDTKNKISFSCKDGVAEQYARALNDSTNNVYSNKKGFVLHSNSWYENTAQ